MEAGLATKTACIATETVDVGPSGVVGYPPCFRVEGVLFIYVIILFVSGLKRDTHVNKTEVGRVHALTLHWSAM